MVEQACAIASCDKHVPSDSTRRGGPLVVSFLFKPESSISAKLPRSYVRIVKQEEELVRVVSEKCVS